MPDSSAVTEVTLDEALLADLETLFQASKDPVVRSAPRLESGELRSVAILFMDIQGFTTLSTKLKAEETHKLVDNIFKIVTNTINRYDGYVDKYMGDALLAIFGTKGKTEASCERAVRAGLSILDNFESIGEVLKGKGLELKVRIGINYGEVSIGKVGSLGTWDTVIGDTVNVAQRIQSAARPNTVLATRDITRMLGDAFLYTNEREIFIKGKEQTIAVAEVCGVNVKHSERWARHYLAAKVPFVGRQRELDLLFSAYDEARLTSYPPEYWQISGTSLDFRNRFFAVTGGAGFGKSRLVDEFKRRLSLKRGEAQLILSGECPNYPVNYFYPFVSAICRYLGIHPASSEKEKALYLDVFYHEMISSLPEEFSFLKERLETTKIAVFHLMQAQANYEKFLELDAKSQDFEKRLGIRSILEALYYQKNSRHLRLLKQFWDSVPPVVKAQIDKPGKKVPPLPEDTPLCPLVLVIEDLHFAAEATLDFISFLLETACTPQPIIIIATFREEFSIPAEWLKSVQPLRVFVKELRDFELRTMTNAMLDGFSLPHDFETELFQRCDGNPFYLEEMVYYLLSEGFLVLNEVEQKYELTRSFKEFRMPRHINELALGRIDSLPKPLRFLVQKLSVLGREFSLSVIRKMEQRIGGDPDALDEAISQLVDSQILIRKDGMEAVGASGGVYQFRHFIQQEAAYATLLHHNRRTLHLIAAEVFEEEYESDIDGYVELLAHHNELGGRIRKACEFYLRHAELLNVRGLFKLANETLEHAIALIDKIEEDSNVRLRLSLEAKIVRAGVLVSLLRHQEAEDICREVGVFARTHGLAAYVADSERGLGVVYRERHRYLNAEEQFISSLTISKEIGDEKRIARALNNLGLLYWELQQYDKSLMHFQEALEIAKRLGKKREIAAALNNTGLAYGHKSGYKEGIKFLEQALAIAQEIGDRWAEANILSNIGLFYANQGRYDIAKNYTPKAEKIRQELGIKGRALTAWWI